MSAFLRALSRLIRLALHRPALAVETGCVYCTSWNGKPHDSWCPRALPVQQGPMFCGNCWAPPGVVHQLSCPEVSPEQFRRFLGGAR